MQLRPGQEFGRYTILSERLAEGLCGPVYQAEVVKDDGTTEVVALKLLTDKRSIIEQYFMNEERLLKRADHPHVIRYVHSSLRERPYLLSTTFIPGIDAKEIARQKEPSWALLIAEQIGSALDYLHQHHPDAPIIHRDVKPDNVLINQDSKKATLIDLSVALHPGVFFEDDATLGTPPYMPPEQYLGEETPATDLYALAGTVFFYLHGKPLPDIKYPKLKEDTPEHIALWKEQVRSLLAKQAETIREKLVAYPATAQVLIQAMRFEPAERYPSCGIFAAALRSALLADGSLVDDVVLELPDTRKRTWLSVVAISALVLSALLVLFLVGNASASDNGLAQQSAPSRSTEGLKPTSTLPPVASSNPTLGGEIAPTSTLPALVLPINNPTSTLPPLNAPTSILPAAAAQNATTTIKKSREIFRAAPGNSSLNLLGRSFLPVGDQIVVLSDAVRIGGEYWYQVQRVVDGNTGWIRGSSFQ